MKYFHSNADQLLIMADHSGGKVKKTKRKKNKNKIYIQSLSIKDAIKSYMLCYVHSLS